MSDTPNLALPLIAAAQAQKHVTHNEALLAIDALLQCAVLDRDRQVPPDGPAPGDRYIVAPGAGGAWAGQAGRIASWRDGVWAFQVPQPGFLAFLRDERLLVVFDSGAWVSFASTLTALQLGLLGIGTAADAGNPFAAKLNKALWTAKGVAEGGDGDLRYTLNKESAGDVLSLLFQSGYVGRAELGLVGSDDVALRVASDDGTFSTGLRGHRDLHGRVAVKDAHRRAAASWVPQLGTAALAATGLAATTSGTATATAPAAGVSFYAQAPRLRFVSAAAAGSVAGLCGAALGWWRGNAADQGGFYLVMRGGFEVFQPNARWFMGLAGVAVPLGNVNPSSLTNLVGIGTDAGETSLRLISNDGSGAASRTDLGGGFPVGGHEVYELILSAEPNAAALRYRVERLNGGNVASGAITSDLPSPAAFLTPHLWANNGSSAGAVEIGFLGLQIESACLSGSRGNLL